jgi:hypothetical protein
MASGSTFLIMMLQLSLSSLLKETIGIDFGISCSLCNTCLILDTRRFHFVKLLLISTC